MEKTAVEWLEEKLIDAGLQFTKGEALEIEQAKELKKKHIVMLIGDKVNEEQTKCYCGHTTYCDCGPEEPKQELTTVNGSYGCTIPKEEPKKETLEEAAEKESEYLADWEDKEMFKKGFIEGAKWQQEQILDFLNSGITERRDYSASKMCEKVIEFIEKLNN
jgi:hypothetical protein